MNRRNFIASIGGLFGVGVMNPMSLLSNPQEQGYITIPYIPIVKKEIRTNRRYLKAKWTVENELPATWFTSDVKNEMAKNIREQNDKEILADIFKRYLVKFDCDKYYKKVRI